MPLPRPVGTPPRRRRRGAPTLCADGYAKESGDAAGSGWRRPHRKVALGQLTQACHLASLSASHLSAASSTSMPSMSTSLDITAISRLVRFIFETMA